MFPKPRTDLTPNTPDFERFAFIKPTGFREYDARWLYPDEINLMGLQAIGMGLAELFRRRGVPLRIVTGHDFRSYSAAIKQSLISGMLAGGMEVHDIGLALVETCPLVDARLIDVSRRGAPGCQHLAADLSEPGSWAEVAALFDDFLTVEISS